MRKPPLLSLMLGLSLWGCSDPVDPPADGRLAVSTSTSGDDPDPDGFQLTVDDGSPSLALPPSGTAELELSPGRHTLQLLGVSEHCSVTPGTSVEVDVTAGRTAPVAFQVICPGTSLQVTVTTTGPDPDQDGYQLMIDGGDALALSPTATAELDIAPGRHTLRLLGVAEHCDVTPGTVLELDFARGSTTPVAYEVDCPTTPPAGFLWGEVFTESGACIRGAMVEIVEGPGIGRKSGQPENCSVWGEEGFSFDHLPVGATVTLRATASGYQSKDTAVVVSNGGRPVQFFLVATPTDFPSVPSSGLTYIRVSAEASGLVSRYVLYEDSTFAVQYRSERFGFFEYTGRHSRLNTSIKFDFDANQGTWWATGTIQGDSLVVTYNLDMGLSDFEDGVYRLATTEVTAEDLFGTWTLEPNLVLDCGVALLEFDTVRIGKGTKGVMTFTLKGRLRPSGHVFEGSGVVTLNRGNTFAGFAPTTTYPYGDFRFGVDGKFTGRRSFSAGIHVSAGIQLGPNRGACEQFVSGVTGFRL